MSRRVKHPKRSSLLTLPVEIRNDICHYALIETNNIHIDSLPGLIAANRQLYTETRAIYLLSNNFTLTVRIFKAQFPTSKAMMHYWLHSIPNDRHWTAYSSKLTSWERVRVCLDKLDSENEMVRKAIEVVEERILRHKMEDVYWPVFYDGAVQDENEDVLVWLAGFQWRGTRLGSWSPYVV